MLTRSLLVALAALTLAPPVPALADPGHGAARAYGEPGSPKRSSRVVEIVMRESDGRMEFVPNRVAVRKGEQIRFVIRNEGELDHEMVVGTLAENLAHGESMRKNPDMEHDDPNARRLAPKGRDELVWRFTKAGEFDFSCLIPGHREAGMFGTITVK